jgi:hypothetical protein
LGNLPFNLSARMGHVNYGKSNSVLPLPAGGGH